MKAFAPNDQLIFESLSQMVDRFEQWSATIAQSDGFQQFIDYVQTNGPTVLSVIGNIVNIIINLATGMAPLASKSIKCCKFLYSVVSNVNTSTPSNRGSPRRVTYFGWSFHGFNALNSICYKNNTTFNCRIYGLYVAGSMVMSHLRP